FKGAFLYKNSLTVLLVLICTDKLYSSNALWSIIALTVFVIAVSVFIASALNKLIIGKYRSDIIIVGIIDTNIKDIIYLFRSPVLDGLIKFSIASPILFT